MPVTTATFRAVSVTTSVTNGPFWPQMPPAGASDLQRHRLDGVGVAGPVGPLGAALLPNPTQLDKKTGRPQRVDQFLVGVAGFEPTTSSSRTKRATKLRYTPVEPVESTGPTPRYQNWSALNG